jgi:hypothetical protein
MFITKEQAENITGYEVDATLLARAQSIIEAYTGKVEAEVEDAGDLALLGKATAYQAAYMKNDTMKVFEQVSALQISQFGQMLTFRADGGVSPFVAPLAVVSCRHLSWRRSRSISTGSVFGNAPYRSRWETE